MMERRLEIPEKAVQQAGRGWTWTVLCMAATCWIWALALHVWAPDAQIESLLQFCWISTGMAAFGALSGGRILAMDGNPLIEVHEEECLIADGSGRPLRAAWENIASVALLQDKDGATVAAQLRTTDGHFVQVAGTPLANEFEAVLRQRAAGARFLSQRVRLAPASRLTVARNSACTISALIVATMALCLLGMPTRGAVMIMLGLLCVGASLLYGRSPSLRLRPDHLPVAVVEANRIRWLRRAGLLAGAVFFLIALFP